ncbi:class I SAM-dependent methyltransferase [Lamprobacter modestohalophilus]|uniref:class I SAM-dependent methyltransferase n=1 Tax=Lamprobacter modestohalophilus TaxID=1064514 RepID=UPI002ADEA9DD|nr:class I SAM-dependent methyltransferase [Lamprobacter modestohalophilus]MEA1050010.1 class I SAM-dependent methyltransferase [Lamprobacter modestohalophilus]
MPRVDTESFYHQALARYGENAEGVHWRSAESQQIRFAVLRDLLPPDLSRISLVDVGCGLGDLHAFLAARNDLPRQYIGLDAVTTMVDRARARTGCAILHCDVLSDPIPEADWYLASGAMALLTHEETGLFITRCLSAARRGLVFNLLKGDHQSLTFNYLMPEAVENWAAEMDVGVEIVEGYLSGDFSVAMTHKHGE